MSATSRCYTTTDRTSFIRTHPQDPPCLHEIFGEQARETPQATALVGGDRELTYEELDGASDILAAALARAGVGRGAAVGIHMERCPEYVVAMLAALKAGGAFLPLELAYPEGMLAGIVSDSEVSVVLTKERYANGLPSGPEIIHLDEGWEEGLGYPTARLEDAGAGLDDLAFIAYSSGTTGSPKGIANPHRAMVGSYLWRFGVDAPGPVDRVGCNVFFIWEALRPLIRGAATIVIPDEIIYSPDELLGFLKRHEVSETLMTPSLLETILNRSEETLAGDLPNLKTLWLNGEVVTKQLAGRASAALPQTRLLNVYSISEAHEVAAGDLRELAELHGSTYCAVGLPADHETVRILDEELEPVPRGEAGELYVGGGWLARGYVGLPEKTAERFPDDPLSGGQSNEPGTRIYRTGDRARLLSGGELEILGRADFMVKVRGYSIELGAVESAIEGSLPVKGCCVVADGNEGEDKRLVAYVVPSGEDEMPDICSETGRSTGIRTLLKESLPHYAIPSSYVPMDVLPLQETTGKVDRNELPPPPERRPDAARSGSGTSLPESPSQQDEVEALKAIFEAVLNLDAGDIGADEDFFEVGGHSLGAAEVLGLVEDTFGLRLPVAAILENPTPSGLRRAVAGHRTEGDRLDAQRSGASSDPRSDAVLEEDISPGAATKPVRITEAKSVFVTGATGFLGGFLVREILENTEAEVLCLVRRRGGPQGAGATAPVRANLRRYGLWKPGYADRLRPVPGDLGEPLLGMSRPDFDALSEDVEVVVHAAAAVNLVYPYSSLKAPNVEGTREVLRFCCAGRPKTLHHVSTNGIFPPGHGECRERAETGPLLDGLEDGYAQTKWAAERLVSKARDRGLPVSVYRPGNISGDTTGGGVNPKDLLSALIQSSLHLGLAPQPDDEPRRSWTMEMTPVDFVARAVFSLADREPNSEDTCVFHLADPSPPTTTEFFDRMEEAGHPLEPVPLSGWLAELSRSDVPATAKAVIGDGSVLAHALATNNAFDDHDARRALARTPDGPRRPTLDAGLLARYAVALQAAEGA